LHLLGTGGLDECFPFSSFRGSLRACLLRSTAFTTSRRSAATPKTVNFDDPGTYHLYYGDGSGSPGSILTFFPFAGLPEGRSGTGQVSFTAFATNEAGLEFWRARLSAGGVEVRGPMERFGETFIAFEDPEALGLEIVAADQSAAFQPWSGSPVPLT
jgi:glyoxalase family protein